MEKEENSFGSHMRKMMPVLGLEKTYTREELKSALVKKLTDIMPKEPDMPDVFKGEDILDAIQFGINKQQSMERLIYQRAINEIDEFIDNLK